MKKTLFKWTGRLAAGLMALSLVFGVLACDNGSGDDDGVIASYSDGSTGTTKESEIMDEALSVNTVLRRDCKAYDRSVLKSFKPASAAPSDGVTTYKLSTFNSPVDVLAWLDGATIWYYAAGYTDSGRKIPLPEPVSVYAGSSASIFSGCDALKSIDMSGFDTSEATSMGSMFKGCTGLTSLDLSSLNTSNVTSMGSMFKGCTGLTSLDLSSLNTSNVTSMDSMFEGCTGLTSLNLSSLNTGNVTSMDGMFKGCTGLTSLDLSSLNTSNVTSMGSMFKGCTGLTSLDLSSLNTSNVTSMDSMFEGCSNLTSLNVSSFDTSKVIYIYSMFERCRSLSILDLSSFDTRNVTSMFAMFNDCTGLRTIYASDRFVTDRVESYSRVLFNGCTNLVGGRGTAYSSSNANDDTFARIDGGASAPGYFTAR